MRSRRYCYARCRDPWFQECADCWRDEVVGRIYRYDHEDVLTRAEAEHWDKNVLPLGWAIISDSRR